MIEGMSKGFIELFDDSIGGKSYIYIHRSTSSNDSIDLTKIPLQEFSLHHEVLKSFQSYSVAISHKVGCSSRKLKNCGRSVVLGTCNSNTVFPQEAPKRQKLRNSSVFYAFKKFLGWILTFCCNIPYKMMMMMMIDYAQRHLAYRALDARNTQNVTAQIREVWKLK